MYRQSHIEEAYNQESQEKQSLIYEVVKLATLVKILKSLGKILLFPFAIGLLAPAAVEAGGGDHKGHHDHHGGHMNMGDSYPSTMFMGKTTFVLGGVDGVSDSGMGGMGGMSTSEEKDGTVFHYDTKLMFMTSFTGQDMLKTAVRVGNFGMMEPFGMMGEARLDTAFSSNDSLELHKAL